MMSESWDTLSIKNICTRIVSGGTPSTRKDSYYGGKIPWLRTQEINFNRIYDTDVKITEEGLNNSSAKMIPEKSVIMAMYGATAGKVAINEISLATNQACCNLIINQAVADYRYVYYQLCLKYEEIANLSIGAAQQNLNVGTISNLPIHLPPLTTQKRIADILGTLDDKIELNRQMNRTLEAMARAIFKSWFVDFDPVTSKMEGRDYPLPAEVLDLFPDELVESELGMIPKGWEVGKLKQGFSITMGQSPPGSTYNEDGDGLPFYQGRRDFGFRYPALRVYCNAPKRLAQPNDSLVSVRAPVGDVNMAKEKCCIGRGVAAIRHKTGSASYTYYSMLKLKEYFNLFESEGTVFGSIGKKDFESLEVVLPSHEFVKAFEDYAGPLDKKIGINSEQIITLASIRDILLQMLISGENQIIL